MREQNDETDYFGPELDEDLDLGANPVRTSSPGRLAGRSLLFLGGGCLATTLYLDGSPEPVPAAITLCCVLVSMLLVVLLALYPGNLAPELRPRPAWWGMLVVLAATSATARLLGGPIWIVLVLGFATTAGAGFFRSKEFGPMVFIAAGVAGLSALAGGQELEIPLEAGAAAIAALFGAQAWQRVNLLQKLYQTRAELNDVTSADRSRADRDLHDLLGHTLEQAARKIDSSEQLFDSDPQGAKRELAAAKTVVTDSLTEVREVSQAGRPSLQRQLASTRRLLAAYGIELHIDGPEEVDLPVEVDVALAWILRESVSNVVKHSQASRCDISLEVGDDAAMQICDDGIGLDPDTVEGFGMAGIEDRIDDLDGTIETPQPEQHGFILKTTIPLNIAASA